MSLAALADDEILRTDRARLHLDHLTPIVDPALDELITTFGVNAARRPALRTTIRPLAAGSPIQKSPGSSALDGLAKYIPTESITLYVAATAAMSSLTATFPSVTPVSLYWGFVALTPIFFLLIYAGKRRGQRLPALPAAPKNWPWWKLIAATIAFMVWALAVPPLVSGDAGKIVSAFGALLISTMLSLVGAVVEPPES